MKRLRVKICGITRPSDAELAVQLGADALGFVLWERSPRHLSVAAAAEISKALPAFVTRVGVVVDMPRDEIADAVRRASLDAVQLHGDEVIDGDADFEAHVIKAVSLETDEDFVHARSLPWNVTVLVNAADRTRRGGTGQRANWSRAAQLARVRPVILAGGLTPDSVAEAVRVVEPWGVDVSSGVEESPGVKSPRRMEEFFDAVASLRG